MAEHYLRKVQKHGTGKETRIPPEVCKQLGIMNGGDIEFSLKPGVDGVTLRKAGTSDKRQGKKPRKRIEDRNPEFEALCRRAIAGQ